jgi:succinate dehydrogenase/fumarate reductase flavoprotein subunit
MNKNYIPSYDAIVIGSGAAGFSAACRLREFGCKRVAIISENRLHGTSRNTGSDKQTYYKLGLGGEAPDSVRAMAEDLFRGGAVDGDTALCEAAYSARCFHYLCEAGVPFPHNAYGEYVGYKTDHDPFARATSAGPLTSKFMTEALEKKAEALGVVLWDEVYAVEILKDENGVCGVLCFDLRGAGYRIFQSANIILATGGPAGIYADTVYPESQWGSTGLALLAGASLQNVTEWQYGLASVCPHWNVSGTYMQVLPRLISIDEDGVEREFLTDTYADPYEALSLLFLKGYQWPFDAKKAADGSSAIDLLVNAECAKGRRVFLDFTKNPFGFETIEFAKLSEEAFSYLQKADACFGTPIERLTKMNAPAVALYRDKGVDLTAEPLEIALCAQHQNGGISVDSSWQTDVKGLYAIGECAGTHGITRPGGSALNAGQVGALRAAESVCAEKRPMCSEEKFYRIACDAVGRNQHYFRINATGDAKPTLQTAREEMSRCAAALREVGQMRTLLLKAREILDRFDRLFAPTAPRQAIHLFRLRDVLTVQWATLSAMLDYCEKIGASRGSALYVAEDGVRYPIASGEALCTDRIQTVRIEDGECHIAWRRVRPLPTADDCFENVWRAYRERTEN